MRHLLEDITSSGIGREEAAENADGLTDEEKTQLRELCVLIVIGEFFETNNGQQPVAKGNRNRSIQYEP